MINYYLILHVPLYSDGQVIKKAYRRLAKQYHPDINSSADAHECMQRLNEAYFLLQDDTAKRLYDIELRQFVLHNQAEGSRSQSEATQGVYSNALYDYIVKARRRAFEMTEEDYELLIGAINSGLLSGMKELKIMGSIIILVYIFSKLFA